MCKSNYNSIVKLTEYYQAHSITVERPEQGNYLQHEDYPEVIFVISNKTFLLYIDDEYKDLEIGNPILNLCLVLRELEEYEDSEDIIEWSRGKGLDLNLVEVRQYYNSLGVISKEVKTILGEIDSQISNYDFELNAGAAQELRRVI